MLCHKSRLKPLTSKNLFGIKKFWPQKLFDVKNIVDVKNLLTSIFMLSYNICFGNMQVMPCNESRLKIFCRICTPPQRVIESWKKIANSMISSLLICIYLMEKKRIFSIVNDVFYYDGTFMLIWWCEQYCAGMQRFPAITWSGDRQDCSHNMIIEFTMYGQLYTVRWKLTRMNVEKVITKT